MENNINDLQSKRIQFLQKLYDQTDGNESSSVNLWELGDKLGFSRSETNNIDDYLKGEGLSKESSLGGFISITHKGIVKVEKLMSKPGEPNLVFPSINIINVNKMSETQNQQVVTDIDQTNVPQTPSLNDKKPMVNRNLLWFFGVIIVAIIGYFGAIEPKIIEINATKTAEARLQLTAIASQTQNSTHVVSPTSIIEISTKEPVSTHTPIAGEDIFRGCVWDLYWTIYPSLTGVTTNVNHCWNILDIWGIYPKDGNLNFVVPSSLQDTPLAIYTPLQSINDIYISFNISIKNFSTKNSNSDLFFGIGDSQSALSNGKYIIYRVLGNSPTIYVRYNTQIEGDPKHIFPDYVLGQTSRIIFHIDGLRLSISIIPDIHHPTNSELFDNISLSLIDKKDFWIGYSIRYGTNLDAFITAPCITPCFSP
jgi:hypothetical protein